MLKNNIDILVTGRNIERFITRLYRSNINIFNIKYIKYNKVILTINKNDYDKIDNLKTIYEIEIINVHGLDKLKLIIKNNIFIIMSFIISIFILFLLSNTIFKVEVIHNDKNLRKIINTELKENGIQKYNFKKSYKELQKIKTKILEKYNDKIEWLEIKEQGTKYIVRVEERIIKKDKNNYHIRDIISKKEAKIIKIEAEDGEVVVNKNQYVHKGDVLITGSLKLYDEVKSNIMAKGNVYGEVWYKSKIEYPYKYTEKVYTGKSKKVIAIQILNNYIELFNFKKYKTKEVKNKIIFKHSFLPISLVYQKQLETIEQNKKLTKKQAIKEAVIKAKEHINNNLSEKEYIIDIKKLKVEENNSKIILELFISVCENITDYRDIIE